MKIQKSLQKQAFKCNQYKKNNKHLEQIHQKSVFKFQGNINY